MATAEKIMLGYAARDIVGQQSVPSPARLTGALTNAWILATTISASIFSALVFALTLTLAPAICASFFFALVLAFALASPFFLLSLRFLFLFLQQAAHMTTPSMATSVCAVCTHTRRL